MRPLPALVLSTIVAALLALSPAPAPGAEGDVRVVKFADSSFDRFTSRPGPRLRRFIRERYTRMIAWSPYFDARTRWYRDALAYQDLYAIYRGSRPARRRPEWILRDGRGRRLYIPFGCERGTCPQYAGDIGNPAFRRWWISEARDALRAGYRGIYVDDVNMDLRVSDGHGREQAPVDPRTGRPMTEDDWRRYVADFAVQIRRALPGAEIVHNALWFAGGEAGDGHPQVRRQLRAADVVNLERGINDPGLTGGDGPWSLRELLAWIDRRHADGTAVVLDAEGETPARREYELAGYLLVSTGRDLVGTRRGSNPGSWWRGLSLALGRARGDRYEWNGVLRRDFEDGVVLLNEPDAPVRRLAVPGGLVDMHGRRRSAVTLGPRRAAVLVKPSVARAAARR
jgi:hypothetical protein